ncbi:MAG: lipoprotein [Burkholderiales bacterium]
MLQRKTSVAARLKAALAVGAWLVVALPLAGCGQKGPLSLPKPAPPASSPASAP